MRAPLPEAADAADAAHAYRTPRRALPLLDDLRVAAPCDVSWDEMEGNGRARHCARCKKPVFNISAMTRADAQLFLLERVHGACVHFYRRADGTILTSDCPVGQRMRRHVQALIALAVAAFAGLLGLAGLSLATTKVICAVQPRGTTGFSN
jgi:hypothetical protein